MLADSLIVPECVYRPGTFSGLMTLYESSYIKLGQLGAYFDAEPAQRLSSVPGDCELHVEVLARGSHTTTLTLTYWFAEPVGGLVPDPDLSLRIYHDARLVEAIAVAQQHRHQKLREFALSHAAELDRRWRRNMTLNKWLDYLLDMGHSFM
jgi:hypothetical protein